MTDRDPRPPQGGPLADRSGDRAAPVVAVEISTCVVEQSSHGLGAVVTSHVGVQVLPDALDTVGVGAVGRQEVQHDATAESGESFAGAASLVDAVVVDDEVDAACASIVAGQQPEQLAQDRALLAFPPPRVPPALPHPDPPPQAPLLVFPLR